MKRTSIIVSVLVLLFLAFDVYAILATQNKLLSPLIPVSIVEHIKRPYIIFAVAHGVVLLVLIGLNLKSLFRISTIVAAAAIVATVVIKYFCLLCVV